MFYVSLDDKLIADRVRAVIGVSEVFLPNDTIISPIFKDKAEIYINNQLSELQGTKISGISHDLIDMSAIYYISYLLCTSMQVRLPNRMENISTKTLLQTIDWYKFGEELLNRCNELIDKILEDEGIEVLTGTTIIALSDETTYPNTSI